MRFRLIYPILCVLLIVANGCYYDNEEELYQFVNEPPCDTLNVSFSTQVQSILATHCTNCHNGSTPSGNISLDSYPKILPLINSGRFWGAISHSSGFSPMPKGAARIPDCQLKTIEAWINQGSLDN